MRNVNPRCTIRRMNHRLDEFPRKAPGSRTFQTKHSCLRLFGGDRKNVDGCTRVARVLSSFRPLPPSIPSSSSDQRKRKKDCWFVSSIQFSRKKNCSSREKKKKKKEFGKEIEEPNYRKKVPKRRRRDKRRLEKHNFIFQLPKQLRIHYPSIHCQQANTTPTKTHRTIAPKEPFTSLYVEA